MIHGNLFARDLLLDGIAGTPAWRALDAEAVAVRRDWIGGLLALCNAPTPLAAAELVQPVLAAIGWGHRVQALPRATDLDCPYLPDMLLFPDPAALAQGAQAMGHRARLRHALCLLNTAPQGGDLDGGGPQDAAAPTARIRADLTAAAAATAGALRWGILTDGRRWRLYRHDASAGPDDFLGIDLPDALPPPGPAANEQARDRLLRLFLMFFGRDAFEPDADGRSFLDRAFADNIPN